MRLILFILITCSIFSDNIEDITSELKFTPNDSELLFRRGYCYYTSGEYEKAINDFSKSLLREEDYLTYFYRGKSYERYSKIRDALNDFEKCIRLNPNYPEANFCAALIHMKVNEQTAASEDFDAAINKNNTCAKYYAWKAFHEYQLGNIDESIKHYEKSLEIDKFFTWSLNNLAWIYLIEKKDAKSALKYSEQCVLYSKEAVYIDTLACIYSEIGNFERAIALEQTLAVNNDLYKEKSNAFKNKIKYSDFKNNKEQSIRNIELQKEKDRAEKERIWNEIVEKNKR